MQLATHLTIRDYFNRVLFEGTAGRHIISSRGADAAGNGEFHRILESHQVQPTTTGSQKTTGLTIVDYLANRVRVKCKYSQTAAPKSSKQNEAGADTPPVFSPHTPPKTTAAKSAVPPPGKNNKSVHSPGQSTGKSAPLRTSRNELLDIEKSVRKAARKYNLPPALIKGIIKAESNFQVGAVSRAGAQGLMQLMPGTARELGVINPFDIEQNIDGGSRYLKKMLDSFDGDVRLALAAYNAGPGTVRKYDGDVPYQETRHYINRVLKYSGQTA
jgi:soluble lytic murein transglycosylase-like protein